MSGEKHHIVVCDDETDLRETIGDYLQKRGYVVSLAENGAALQDLLETVGPVDAILLDINMPGDDGLTVLRRLRAERKVAVIMLTAAGGLVDRVVGLEMGADDYLTKPIDLRELEAHIKAVLRRPDHQLSKDETETAGIGGDTDRDGGKITIAGLVLDLAGARLCKQDGSEIPMTAMEFMLLKVFVENRGRVLSRVQLLDLTHDNSCDAFDRTIDIRISRLRRKIEADPSEPALIRTVRGMGYIFDPKAS